MTAANLTRNVTPKATINQSKQLGGSSSVVDLRCKSNTGIGKGLSNSKSRPDVSYVASPIQKVFARCGSRAEELKLNLTGDFSEQHTESRTQHSTGFKAAPAPKSRSTNNYMKGTKASVLKSTALPYKQRAEPSKPLASNKPMASACLTKSVPKLSKLGDPLKRRPQNSFFLTNK